ncbi:hypothetical protein BC941DRAFT_501907 [Chlamydoabsidia padenii]|nr:hypothetical protein BC941DRAFT_501907 [Chlamydoabsidia padenii]
MDMVIKAVVGSQAIGKYACTPGEWLDGGRSDIVFTAKYEDMLPPVLIEIQNAVDIKFIDWVTCSDADIIAGKRVHEYADDTLLYLSMCHRKYMERSSSPPSIPYPMDLPNDIHATEPTVPFENQLPESSISAASVHPDFEFVDAFRAKAGKSMNWQACYRTGRAQGYLTSTRIISS